MAKKDILNGFKLKILPEVSNGLIIPTGNSASPPMEEPIQQIVSPFVEPKVPPDKLKKQGIFRKKIAPNFQKLSFDSQAFTPMTNVIPTIEEIVVQDEKPKFKGLSRRARQTVTPENIDLMEFGALQTKQERISYLAIRGWSLKIERRGNGYYYYATKYFNRKKKRQYVCSVNQDM